MINKSLLKGNLLKRVENYSLGINIRKCDRTTVKLKDSQPSLIKNARLFPVSMRQSDDGV